VGGGILGSAECREKTVHKVSIKIREECYRPFFQEKEFLAIKKKRGGKGRISAISITEAKGSEAVIGKSDRKVLLSSEGKRYGEMGANQRGKEEKSSKARRSLCCPT